MTEARTGEILQKLQEIIQRQYALNAGTTLREIKAGDGSSYTIHPQVLTFCWGRREGVLHVLRAEIHAEASSLPQGRRLVPLFVASTAEHLYRNNQFISLSAEEQEALAALYLEYLRDLVAILSDSCSLEEAGRRLWAAQLQHLSALQAFVSHLERRYRRQGESLLDQTAVCAEYSASLQLSVLGIDERALLEPILDIGCGRQGTLVTYLRGLGLQAYGIDRLPPRADYCLQVDWLQFHFQGAYWGTIVSHMAFSNHFIFHHLYRQGTPEAYARKYMEVLAALRLGGELYYAPGLPFIEPLLPAARFRVAKRGVPIPLVSTEGTQRQKSAVPSGEMFGATRITRLA